MLRMALPMIFAISMSSILAFTMHWFWCCYRKSRWYQIAILTTVVFFAIGAIYLVLAGGSEQNRAGRLHIYSGHRDYPSKLSIAWSGKRFSGVCDDHFGKALVVGEIIDNDKITMIKEYDISAKRKGALLNPINFKGKLFEHSRSGDLIATGTYWFLKDSGWYGSRKKFIYSGDWSAEIVRSPK